MKGNDVSSSVNGKLCFQILMNYSISNQIYKAHLLVALNGTHDHWKYIRLGETITTLNCPKL